MRKQAFVGVLCCLLAASAEAQSPATQPAPTLHVNVRDVLIDVTVTDSHGNPVQGLKKEEFQVFDDGRPQTLNAFEEHSGNASIAAEPAAGAAGVFTNRGMLHPPPVVNVILIDTTTIGIADQMYLYQQLARFVQNLPAATPLAIYSRAGQMTLLLQGFTSDHALLMKAIHRAIPHVEQPEAQFATDDQTLEQIAGALVQVPGRKNILWFSGGSQLFLQVDPSATGVTQVASGASVSIPVPAVSADANQPDLQYLYDLLERARITLYPIDARGLVSNPVQGYVAQQEQMKEDAEATGGQAWYDTNDLAQVAGHIVTTDGDYYSLAYSPDHLRGDGRWRHIQVKLLVPGYRLSYRRGYFDEQWNQAPPGAETKGLLAENQAAPDISSEPIPLQAEVVEISPLAVASAVRAGQAHAPERGELSYVIDYQVPAGTLTPQSVSQNGRGTFVLGAGAFAFDRNGDVIKRQARVVTLTADETEIRSKPEGKMSFDETISLPKGQDYLYLVVWDATSGRMGTINVSLDVKKSARE